MAVHIASSKDNRYGAPVRIVRSYLIPDAVRTSVVEQDIETQEEPADITVSEIEGEVVISDKPARKLGINPGRHWRRSILTKSRPKENAQENASNKMLVTETPLERTKPLSRASRRRPILIIAVKR